MTTFFLKIVLLISVMGFVQSCIKSRKYSRCEFAKLLLKQGFPRNQLGDWVCLAENESNLQTDRVNTVNSDGSFDYGIFQFNSRYWCQGEKTESNGCNKNCSEFLDDNLSDDIDCATKVNNTMGFSAWVAWKNKCQGKNVNSYISGCNL